MQSDVTCFHPTCGKISNYTIDGPERCYEICNTPSHIKWALDLTLSSSPGTAASFDIQRRMPRRPSPTDDVLRFTVSMKVDREAWANEYGVAVEEVHGDVKSHILNGLQAGYEGSDEMWDDVVLR
ncbi:hypothetical protein [Streptomyces sp. NPDC006631]|uniref:hypothetical protein n=1 Tax=Streptomyces sp. NPDC006631 TaxID=3364752 RepID=UPI0036B63BAE